jgi:hypothetical protein
VKKSFFWKLESEGVGRYGGTDRYGIDSVTEVSELKQTFPYGKVPISITNVHIIQRDYSVQNWGHRDGWTVMTTLL